MISLKKHFRKRNMPRYIPSRKTEVQILFSSENPSLLGKTIKATAVEMSPKGIRLDVAHPIAIDSVLDIVIRMEGIEKEYYLTGNVRWRVPSPSSDEHYHIGLVLRERTDEPSDFKQWKAHFNDNFEFAQVC